MNLDDLNIYKEIDNQDLYRNIQELPFQCKNAWIEINKLVLPSYYLKVNKVLILGMGGSGIGGELACDFTLQTSEIPIYTHHNYGIPEFIDEKTLVIAVSYSGNTEEIIDGFVEAYKKDAKLIAITSGGELEKLAQKYRAPYYRFAYKSPPRAALGYLFISIMGILKKLNIADISQQDINTTISMLQSQLEKMNRDIPTVKNPAKKLAQVLSEKIPIIYGADFMRGVAIRWKTQFNENAKVISYAEVIPESNHNSLVGLEFPESIQELFYFIILQSRFDHPKSKIRQDFFEKTLKKQKISVQSIILPSSTNCVLAEICGMIYWGDLTSYYLAIINKIDPYPVEIINQLKQTIKGEK